MSKFVPAVPNILIENDTPVFNRLNDDLLEATENRLSYEYMLNQFDFVKARLADYYIRHGIYPLV